MSTTIYLQCDAHDPAIRSDAEVGQHLSDLPRIREDLADRQHTIARVRHPSGWRHDRDGWDAEGYFRGNVAGFLMRHPHCPISIIDEYDHTHPLTGDET